MPFGTYRKSVYFCSPSLCRCMFIAFCNCFYVSEVRMVREDVAFVVFFCFPIKNR